MPGQSSYTSILLFIVFNEKRVGVLCSMYDMLHADAKCYTMMCKLVNK